jgi:YggT family protein
MSIAVEIIQGLGSIFTSLLTVYMWVIIVNALLSFVNPDPYNPVVQFLHRITEPAYRVVRSKVKTDFGGLDLAPLFIIIGLQVIIVIFSAVLKSLH